MIRLTPRHHSVTRNLRSVLFALSFSLTAAASAAVVTFTFDGEFASSDWNNDSTNAVRTPGGPVSGHFSVDTDTLSVVEMHVSTEFISLFGNQVMGGEYRFGIPGETDDELGALPARNIRISGRFVTPTTRVSLKNDLTGEADPDGAGGFGTGSLIQVLDNVPAGTFNANRIYRPRLSLFLEDVDLRNFDATQNYDIHIREQVWNVNIGNGRAGFSGSQSWGTMTATVPEPGVLALSALGMVLFGRRRR